MTSFTATATSLGAGDVYKRQSQLLCQEPQHSLGYDHHLGPNLFAIRDYSHYLFPFSHQGIHPLLGYDESSDLSHPFGQVSVQFGPEDRLALTLWSIEVTME